MADRYWVGGTASWDGTAGTKWATTSGGGGGASVPTSADDVFFSVLSTGTCTIATGNTGAKSINCTGFTGTITGNANITVAGSITLFISQTYTHTGTVTLTGTGTLTTAGKTFNPLIVNGSGITVTLGDALNMAARDIAVTQGTFNTANFNVTANSITSSNSNTRTITLGSSTLTLSGNPPIEFSTSTNLTFNSNTSQINVSSATAQLRGGGLTFYNVSFTSGSTGTRIITGANTFNNLSLTASSLGLSQLSISANQTVNDTFTCAGTSARNRGFVRSDTIGTTRTITANAISANDCDFRDITLAGSAAGASPTRAGDGGGNSGITFPTAKTVYWNLAGALFGWDANAWATTSSGTPALDNLPLAQDTAIFTESGTLGQINIASVIYNLPTIDMSSRTTATTLNFGGNTLHYGSFILGSGVTISGTGTVSFLGRGTQTFTSAAQTITFPITVDKPAGAFELGDATTTLNSITLTRGTLNAAGYNLTCLTFNSNNSNTRTLTLGNGLWTLTGTGTLWNISSTTGLTFNKGTSNILLSNTSTTSRGWAGGGLTYNKLTIGGTTGTSTFEIANDNNTFSEIDSTKTVAHTIAFNNNGQTFTTWSVTGTAGNVVTVRAVTAGTQRTITVTNKTDGIDYLNVQDISSLNRTPITFYAGANSTNSGNNTGVAFIASSTASPQTAYLLTTGTTFTVPSDWNSSNNNIYMIGAGGGGATTTVSGNNRAAGGGGGGGAYTKLTNFTATPSSSVTYAIGTSVSNADGGNTTWDSGTYIANGGLRGTVTTTPTSAGGAGGTAQTVSGIITAAYAGGNGGAGSFGTAASTGYGSGAGGGAGGPNGVGGNGGTGFGSSTAANIAGGGGGGNGGGSNGGNAASATFGNGGNNFAGTGGATIVNTNGTFGGGGSGVVSSGTGGGNGGSGIDILNTLGGAGGKGGAATGASNNTGLYGGGGTGGTVNIAGGTTSPASGSQGVIFIVYTPSGGTILFGSSSINGTATVTGLGNYTALGIGSMSASATVSSSSSLTFSVSGAINGTATVSALGSLSQFGIASINGTASVSALGGLLNVGQASITANGTVTANGGLVFGGQSSINGTATVTSLGGLINSGNAQVTAFANVVAIGNYTTIGTAGITANGTVIANGVIQGEGWNPITPSSDTWTTVTAGTETWTDTTPSTDIWLRQG